jgi:tRNA A-37 threonylcarbamoyl transferase component Bud32
MENGRLGKYEIRGTLGKGAMGTVYDGYDAVIDRRVAIKTISLPDPSDSEAQEELARFRREAQAAGRLTHPNIVAVYDYGEDGQVAFIVMEYAPGTELKKILDKGDRLPPAEAVRIMEGVLAGLQFSHERGVVHRDIKPGNIILSTDGTVKIADFGIARIESSNMTQAGTIMGTPAYMSPEQFMGQTVDARTDIYSAGVMFYQLLTGERPFEGGMSAIMHKALNTEPPRPSDLSVTAPSALDAVVARAMAKRPEARFDSAANFAIAIRAAMEGGGGVMDVLAGDDATMVSKRPAAPPSRPAAAPVAASVAAPVASAVQAAAPPAKSKTALFAGVAVGVLAVAGVGGYFVLGGGKQAVVAPQAAPAISPAISPATPQASATAAPTSPFAPPAPPVVDSTPVVPTTAAVMPATVPAPAVTEPTAAPPASAPTMQTASIAATPALIRDALAASLHNASCSLTHSTDQDGHVVVSGVIGRNAETAAADLARASLPAGASADSYTLRLNTFDGPYCGVVDLIRAAAAQPIGLNLRNNATVLRKDDDIVPQITMPDFPAWLTVDYFSSDGGVAHLHPTTVAAAHQEAAGSHITLGNTPKERWQVDVPFGTDMIVAIASSAPLFTRPRPNSDTGATYLTALNHALNEAAHNNTRLAASIILLQTKPR